MVSLDGSEPIRSTPFSVESAKAKEHCKRHEERTEIDAHLYITGKDIGGLVAYHVVF